MKKFLKDKYLLLYSISFFTISMLFGLLLILSVGTENSMPTDGENIYIKREGWEGAWFFLSNNLKVSLLLISGILIFGITTIPILCINGFWLGSVIASQYLSGLSIMDIFLAILPHGIFEIPALLLAGYLGLVGFKFYSQEKNWRKLFNVSLGIIILLTVASLIEGFLTPNYI